MREPKRNKGENELKRPRPFSSSSKTKGYLMRIYLNDRTSFTHECIRRFLGLLRTFLMCNMRNSRHFFSKECRPIYPVDASNYTFTEDRTTFIDWVWWAYRAPLLWGTRRYFVTPSPSNFFERPLTTLWSKCSWLAWEEEAVEHVGGKQLSKLELVLTNKDCSGPSF